MRVTDNGTQVTNGYVRSDTNDTVTKERTLGPTRDQLTFRRYSAGDPVYSRNDVVENFHIVRGGLLGLYRFTSPKKRVLIHKIHPGETIGITQLLNKSPYPAQLVPLTEILTERGDRSSLESLREETLDDFILDENQTLERVYDKLTELLSGTVKERIAWELLDLAELCGRDTESGTAIAITLTRKDISRMVGSSKETVSRIMSDWEKDDIIETNQKIITLLEPDELETLLEQSVESLGVDA